MNARRLMLIAAKASSTGWCPALGYPRKGRPDKRAVQRARAAPGCPAYLPGLRTRGRAVSGAARGLFMLLRMLPRHPQVLHDLEVAGVSCLMPVISRQKIVGWILIVVSAAYIAYFLRVRLFAPGPILERKEWVQFIGSFVILMLGTINVRMAAMRERRRKGSPE